jgi:hypothetical protein
MLKPFQAYAGRWTHQRCKTRHTLSIAQYSTLLLISADPLLSNSTISIVAWVVVWLLGDIFNVVGALLQGVLPTMIILTESSAPRHLAITSTLCPVFVNFHQVLSR